MSRTALLLEQNWNAVPGGTARATNRLVRALVQHTSVEVVGVHGSHQKGPNLELPNGIETVEVPIPGRALQQLWSRADRPRIERWVDASIVHAPAYVLPPTKLPVVATIHDLAFVRHPEWFTPNGVRFFRRFLDQVRNSDAIVVVPSATTANDCVSHGIAEDRVRVVPWGIDVDPATSDEVERVRSQYGLAERFVLYVGTLEPRKNLAGLVAATRKIDVPLVIVGPDGWGDNAVAGSPGTEQLLGEVPARDLGPLMAAATVLGYPSLFEGFGLPVLEALAQGTRVLVNRNTVPAEIAGDAGVAVDATSTSAMASALADMFDERRREQFQVVAARRVEQFRWQSAASAHAAIYEELL